MPYSLNNKTIALGVTGSIACYKAADFASRLVRLGADVDVLMTDAAQRFISPFTFRSLTHRPVVTSLFEPDSELSINHVAVAERADLVAIVPATANTLAKIALGFADDPVSATVLATAAPILAAPAMDGNMFASPAVRANVRALRERGVHIAGPAEGRLASGLVGVGRLTEPAELVGHVRMMLGADGELAGRKIVITAGGTREPIDPVRVIANRSSGKMGYAVAEAARDRGADAVLVTSPTALDAPVGVKIVPVGSALSMRDALYAQAADADAVIMAAAVGDWRAAEIAESKAKKGDADEWSVDLVKNPDIIAGLPSERLIKVGFAAESEDLIANAQSKLISKDLRLIVANDITATDAGFATDDNRVIILDREGGVQRLPLMPKYDVAARILDRVAEFFHD